MPTKESSIIFKPETANILLSVTPSPDDVLSVKNIAEEKGLSLKDEFHCTIIGRATGEQIVEILDSKSQKDRDVLMLELEKLYKKYLWEYVSTQEYYLISKEYDESDKRESLVQIVELPDMVNFYAELNALLQTDFEIPFSHITLFTNSTKEDKKKTGIGIYSKEQFESLHPQRIEVKVSS